MKHVSREQGGITARQYFPGLNGIRAIAVLMVIYFHLWQNFSVKPGLVGTSAKIGQTGVHLFFVLSGFLITGILIDSKNSDHCYRNFYIRRFLRIFPLYYVTLFLIFILLPSLHLAAGIPWDKSAWYWLYAQNFPPTFAPLLVDGPSHFWTLAVEEQFYLLWPLFAVSMSLKGLLRSVAAGLVVAITSRIILGDRAAYFTLPQMDGLLMGSALAILGRLVPGGLATTARWAKVAIVAVVPACAGIAMLLHFCGVSAKPIRTTFIALIYTCIVALTTGKCLPRPVRSVLANRAVGSIGKVSYGMYIFHPFIIQGLRKTPIRFDIFGILITVGLSYLAALVSWRLLENPFLKLKRHFDNTPHKDVLTPA